jgi:cytochrome c oxidase subunit 3
MAKSYDERSFAVHPSAMIMILILFGVTALFGALSIAYIYTRVDKGMLGVKVPVLFIFNTLVLIFSSVCIQRCRQYFDKHKELLCYRWGMLTVISTVLFLILQGIGWYMLFAQNIKPSTSGGFGFLYAISILHFLHVMAGIPFLSRIMFPLMVAIRQGNAEWIFRDSAHRRRLRHTAWYWHFIDVVWIYLMIFFIVNSHL